MGNRESYTPWMRSLLNAMKEKYGKSNAKTIAEALPDIGEGSGGEVTPASVASAISRMSDAQAAQALADLGYTVDATLDEESSNPVRNYVVAGMFAAAQLILNQKANKETTVRVSDTSPTITPEDNHFYKCSELASLTISNPAVQGSYTIVFTSGSTPTQAIIPPAPAMRWQTDDNEPPQGFPAANTRYEINVVDTYVALSEWPVPEVSA